MTLCGVSDNSHRISGPAQMILWGAVIFAFAGCSGSGPQIGYVEGIVTLDGDPLPEAFVFFRHDDGGRNSQAVTDEQGRFELNYNASEAGAIVGSNTVRISTFVEPNFTDAGNLIPGTGKPELVPARYNKQSELKVEVEPRGNHFEFELVSSQ